jgi:hypothetical protein
MAKNSTYTKNSRYTLGGQTETDGLKFLEWWDRTIFPVDTSDNVYTLEKIYEGRPDRLASVLYGDSSLWWLILQYNNILDLNEEFVEGVELTIPTKERVVKEFLVGGKSGGISSTRIKKSSVTPIVK